MNATTTTTTTTDNAPFMEARQCRGCKVYRVDLFVDGDLCDDCDPDDTGYTADEEAAMRDCAHDCSPSSPCDSCADLVDGPTVDFHE